MNEPFKTFKKLHSNIILFWFIFIYDSTKCSDKNAKEERKNVSQDKTEQRNWRWQVIRTTLSIISGAYK